MSAHLQAVRKWQQKQRRLGNCPQCGFPAEGFYCGICREKKKPIYARANAKRPERQKAKSVFAGNTVRANARA